MECSKRESNPRPLVHKTSALPIELQELHTNLDLFVIFIKQFWLSEYEPWS